VTDIQLKIGFDVLRSYRRLAYTPWYALAEFIDNSTQSYFNDRNALDRAYKQEKSRLVVEIEYDRGEGVLTVKDNAMGMSLDELRSAVHIGKPPAVASGRSQFGLGLKTAAGWFGDKWSVRTKKLGKEYGHVVTVDVDRIVNGPNALLPHEQFEAGADEHFTEIKVEKMHQVLQGRRLGKTKEFLKSMYRVDSREGMLTLKWDGELLKWDDKNVLLRDSAGMPVRDEVNFKVGKRRVKGWAGVLAPGCSRRSNAGFAIIRRGRVIRGWPEPWRPEAIFGAFEGSNDLINQRVTGEFELDDFDVTHTKDDVLFEDDEEDLVEEGIRERIGNVMEVARTFRKMPPPEPISRRVALEAAARSIALDVRTKSIRKAVVQLLRHRFKPEVLAMAFSAVAARVAKERAILQFSLTPDAEMRVVVSDIMSSEDPYALTQVREPADEWMLAVNAAHPACELANGEGAMHLVHLVADAVAWWAAAKQSAKETTPMQWFALKDAVLRAIAEEDE
jgi:hypothetical protein